MNASMVENNGKTSTAQVVCGYQLLNKLCGSRARPFAVVLVLMTVPLCCRTVLADVDEQSEGSSTLQGRGTLALDGKRLFFNAEQRQGSFNMNNSDSTVSDDSDTDVDRTVIVDEPVVPAAPVAIRDTVAETGVIHYHARIAGSDVIRIIVNGLPCDAVDRAGLSTGLAGTVLNCPTMIVKPYQMRLLSDGLTVQIMNGRQLKGIITPGESL